MKSTHRTQAKAKRSQRTHYVMTYGLLDTLFASPDAPMPAEKRRHQLTRMYGGLRAMETALAPTRNGLMTPTASCQAAFGTRSEKRHDQQKRV